MTHESRHPRAIRSRMTDVRPPASAPAAENYAILLSLFLTTVQLIASLGTIIDPAFLSSLSVGPNRLRAPRPASDGDARRVKHISLSLLKSQVRSWSISIHLKLQAPAETLGQRPRSSRVRPETRPAPRPHRRPRPAWSAPLAAQGEASGPPIRRQPFCDRRI